MENFPTKSFRSQGALRFLRAFSSEVGKKIVVIDLERAGPSLDSAIVEYAHLVINPADGSVASGWGLINPKSPIDGVMSQKHKIYAADVEGRPSMEAHAEKLADLYAGSIIAGGRHTKDVWHTLKQGLLKAGIKEKFLNDTSLLDVQSLVPHENEADPTQTFDRVMLTCGRLSAYIFKHGATDVLNCLTSQELESPGLEESSAGIQVGTKVPPTEVVENRAEDQPLISDGSAKAARVKEWLQLQIHNEEIFPSWSQKFLIEKLQQKSPIPGGPIDPSSSTFGFALSDALKSGSLHPSRLIHPGLMKTMVPTLASLITKPQLTLTEAQKSLTHQTAKTFDYPMIRAALMILGHPSYGVTRKPTTHSTINENKPAKSRSPSM